jgi:hypothetical protein
MSIHVTQIDNGYTIRMISWAILLSVDVAYLETHARILAEYKQATPRNQV